MSVHRQIQILPCRRIRMKAEESSIPAGRHFLPGNTVESMRAKQLGEEDPRAAERLLAYIMRKKGMSIRQICAALNRPYPAVRDRLVRAVQLGVGGRYDISNPRTPDRLDAAQLGQLKADLIAGPQSCGFKSGTWTARLVAEHVRRRFGVEYRTVSMYDILHSMGFSCRKPRPKHPEPASESAKRAFKKKARRIMRDNPGHRVAALDGASHIIG